ncbi:MAG: glycosyltransferase [Pseudomonadota bacterium]|nr:glycosyltransferase [Pseudomonadota bacterium]
MKVALFTPWPPQHSGIADYAYRLAEGFLQHRIELEVFTAAASPAPLQGCTIHRLTAEQTPRFSGDAVPVFQLGNNVSYHAFQPAALARLGGLVQLHDPVLHHLHVDRTLGAGEGGYWNDLEFWYGSAVVQAAQRLFELDAPPWSNSAATAIPLFEPYLQFADAVLVHSQSALRAISRRMPMLAGYCLPQCYPMSTPAPRPKRSPAGPLRLGVFGWVEPHKRVDQILAAMAELRRRGVETQLEICGALGPTMGALTDQIRALGLESAVQLKGHLRHEAFIAEIAGVDLCVNLREPTMGETSAVVIQSMQLGTPVIVTATGWYAELPECVLKVPSGPGAVDALAAHLATIDADRQLLDSLAASTRLYATTELDFAAMIRRYVDLLAELANARSRRRAIDAALYRDVATALADLELSGSPHEQAIAAHIVARVGSCC